MPLEAKPFRHVAVAIPQVRVSRPAMSRLVAHVAVRMCEFERCVQIARRLEVFGAQGGVFVDRIPLALFDCGGHPSVSLGAIRLELSRTGPLSGPHYCLVHSDRSAMLIGT